MVKFRLHRGMLADSMKTLTEINSIDDIRAIVEQDYRGFDMPVREIKIDRYAYDRRIDWDTHIVTAKFHIDPRTYVIGFTNGMIQ